MTTAMSREQLIAAMEEFSRAALVKLQGYKEVEREYKQTVRALKVLQGSNGNVGRNGRNGHTAPAKTAPAKTKRQHKQPAALVPGSIREKVYLVLKAHPAGLSVEMIGKEVGADSVAVHNALRPIRKALKVVKGQAGRSGMANLYSL